MISGAKFELKHLNRINNYLRENGKRGINLWADIKKIQNQPYPVFKK